MKVLIIQDRIPDYRVEFFRGLRKTLLANGHSLELVYAGTQTAGDLSKNDSATVEFASKVATRRLRLGSRGVVLMHAFAASAQSDVVVCEQANKYLLTLWLLLRRMVLRKRRPLVVLWGHGANLQAKDSFISKISEALKKVFLRGADYFLGYTAQSVQRVIRAGFPSFRTTVLNNSVSTAWASNIQPLDVNSKKCVFLGSLYPDKLLEFTFHVALRLAEHVEGFELHIAGDGPEEALVRKWRDDNEWLVWHGRLTGELKRSLLEDAACILNPGLIGLVVLDSFASGRPIVTCEGTGHSPEFEYLRDGVNAVVTASRSVEVVALAVESLLDDSSRLWSLSTGCIDSANLYTLSAMIENFVAGLERAHELN